jgi:signal transduction histidine kinase
MKNLLSVFVLFLIFLMNSMSAHGEKLLLSEWIFFDESIQEWRPYHLGQDAYRYVDGKVNEIELEAEFPGKVPCRKGGCWLFLGELADSATVFLNGHLLASYQNSLGDPYYLRHRSNFLPLPDQLVLEKNKITVRLIDLNETIFGLRSAKVFIGSYELVYRHAIFDEFKRTFSTVFSVFSLLLLFFGLIAIFLFFRDRRVLYLLFYCFSAGIYLFSFSEFPREYLNPLLLSGHVHLALRLLQDLALFALIYAFMPFLNKRVRLGIVLIYLLAILTLFLMWPLGYQNYIYPQTFILLCAPLIAFPMFYGLFLSQRLLDPKERKLLGVFFFVLTAFQLSDLLVYWQVYRFMFFVRWYPSIIVLALGVMLLRRKFLESMSQKRDAEIGYVARGVIHDLKSPMAALKLVLDQPQIDVAEKESLLKLVSQRIFAICEDLSLSINGKKKSSYQSIESLQTHSDLNTLLKDLVAEKKLEFSEFKELHLKLVLPESKNLRVKIEGEKFQ